MPQEDAASWRAVKPGDMVALSDAQTIIARMKDGKGTSPADYEISSVLSAPQLNNLAEWRFFKLGQTSLWLMAKLVDRNLALLVLRDAPDWEPATRKELVDKEMLFLFNAPKDPGNFEYEELAYVEEINVTNSEINSGTETFFYMKPQREQHAKADWQPPQSGIGQQIATIVEYAAEANKGFVDTELVILELGAKASDGVIRFLVGRPLASVDVNVMQRG